MSLVEFGRYPDAALAHIVRGKLEAAGIGAFCFDTGMNVVESVPMMFQVRVMVLADELDAARRVIGAKDIGPVEIVDEEHDFNDEPFLGLERKSTASRQRSFGRWVLGYIGVFIVLGWLVHHFLPQEPPPIEAEPRG